ncbi:hypothetical protein A3Q35_17480 [Aeribacillus pallidus]|nr:hypothetical protein A3Q35_17480 [Aeribacillus pallidus]
MPVKLKGGPDPANRKLYSVYLQENSVRMTANVCFGTPIVMWDINIYEFQKNRLWIEHHTQ